MTESVIGTFLPTRPCGRRSLSAAMLALATMAVVPAATPAPLIFGGQNAIRLHSTGIVTVAEAKVVTARLPRPRPETEAEAPPAAVKAIAAAATLDAAAESGETSAPKSVAAVIAEARIIPASAVDVPVTALDSQPAKAGDTSTDQALLMPRARPSASDANPEASGEENAASDGGEAVSTSDVFLPRPRPELSAAEAARLLAMQFYGFQPDFILKAALDSVTEGRYAAARNVAATHENALVPALVEWLAARRPDSGMSAAKIISILANNRGWPEPEQLQLRAEQAFHALGPKGDAVLAFYNQVEPLTVGGRMALAGALRDAGRIDEATAIVRTLWREWSLASGQAAALFTRFGAMLTEADHLYRFRRLVLRSRLEDSIAQAQLLGDGYVDLARAVIAVLDQKKDARKLLAGVAPRFLGDPLYVFARMRLLRRSGQPIEAARFLLGSQPDMDLSGDGDIWWEERQDLSRGLLDRGTADLAYQVVAGAQPEGEGRRVAKEFHAGWYALRFLSDPASAERHFRNVHTLATLPRTQARASYWLGRTREAEGRTVAAQLNYVEAARFGGTFYGQLAREKLGITTTGMERMPRPSALDRLRFADRDLVKVVRLLAAAGYADLSLPFLRALGESVDTPGEVALLSTLARRLGRSQAAIAAAAAAEERGLKVASLPALFFGVPAELRPPSAVDRALVYAIVRQESAFNQAAISQVGARGLMQLMPATARATARQVQIPYSEQRLLTDPLYNATLGAYHLGELLGGLKRSYILAFAGYNAGPGRALDWVEAYGDPRGGSVDAVDWIERIPFDETRDYVQKVMENLQLYRSRIGHPLSLSEDLVRGGPQG